MMRRGAALFLTLVVVATTALRVNADYCVCSQGSRADGTLYDPKKLQVLYGCSNCSSNAVVATATYGPWFNYQGWSVWKVRPVNISEDRNGAYFAAGFAEGYVTQASIWGIFYNTMLHFFYLQMTPNATRFVKEHIDYINATSRANPKDRYWGQVGALFSLVEGITAGYNARMDAYTNASDIAHNATRLTFYDIFMINLQLEVADIVTATTPSTWDSTPPMTDTDATSSMDAIRKHMRKPGHCSAVIRIADNDLFMSHVTWMYYNVMLRQYKVYFFETTVAMSGYPGMIASFDDWYMTSNSLSVQETTNIIYNTSLYQHVLPNTVSEFLRVMTANYLATNGSDWVHLASTENSGTYNNQWMVVDHNIANPRLGGGLDVRVPDGTLWIYEQLPGPYGRFADVSHVLRQQGYWASYNLPYFEEVYNISGNRAMLDKYGSYFSYTDYARPKIFAREAPKVQTAAQLRELMRYNNYMNEPYSVIPADTCKDEPQGVCSPARSAMLTISSRGDLDPYNCSEMGTLCAAGGVGQQNGGAVDAKLTSWTMMRSQGYTWDGNFLMKGEIISGPTFNALLGLPMFDWNWTAITSANIPHLMLPDFYYNGMFDWMVATTDGSSYLSYVTPRANTPPTPPSDGSTIPIAIGCVVGGLILIAGIIMVARSQRCHSGGFGGDYKEITETNGLAANKV